MVNDDKLGVTVYCASSPDVDKSYFEAAKNLGAEIARAGLTTVCGGGRSGLMAALIDGAVEAGGEAVGVLPGFMIERNWHHPRATKIIETDSMHSRKRTMAELSRAAIALPGGCGTFEELLEIITWRQLGLFGGHVIIYNVNGYYDPLINMLEKSIEQHFMNPDHAKLWSVVTSAREALEIAVRPIEKTEFTQKIKD